MNFETISIVGLGYIGLPTAAVFASRGVEDRNIGAMGSPVVRRK